MILILTITSEERQSLGQKARHQFDQSGGTIGRSASCTWSLNDPSNVLSSRHASIFFNGSSFQIQDTSTNGVFLNLVSVPLGRGNSAVLADGDTLYLGNFVIEVRVREEDQDVRNRLGATTGGVTMRSESFPNSIGGPSISNTSAAIPALYDPIAGLEPRVSQPSAAVPQLSATSDGSSRGQMSNEQATFPGAEPHTPLPANNAAISNFAVPQSRPSRFSNPELLNQAFGTSVVSKNELMTPMPDRTTEGRVADGRRLAISTIPDDFFSEILGPASPGKGGPGGMSGPPMKAPLKDQGSLAPSDGASVLNPSPGRIPDDFDINSLLQAETLGPMSTKPQGSLPSGTSSAGEPVIPTNGNDVPDFGLNAPTSAIEMPRPSVPAIAFPVPTPDLGSKILFPYPTEPGPNDAGLTFSNSLTALPELPRLERGSEDPDQDRHSVEGLGEASRDPVATLLKRGASVVNQSALHSNAIVVQPGKSVPPEPTAEPKLDVSFPLPAPGSSLLSSRSYAGSDKSSDLPTGSDADALVNKFWQGLGVDAVAVGLSRQGELLDEFGRSLRVALNGLVDVLHARRLVKSELRMEQTQVKPRENNPLKFLSTGDAVIEKMINGDLDGFSSLMSAVVEGFNDIRAHELASMIALDATIRKMLSYFDPSTLQSAIPGGSLFGRGPDKAKLWDSFVRLHESLSQDLQESSKMIVGDEFSRAYEEQIAEIRRGRSA